jgi:hypothetical protein
MAYSLRVRLEASSAVQIGALTWSSMAERSIVVQDGPGPVLAEALAVLVCAALPKSTHQEPPGSENRSGASAPAFRLMFNGQVAPCGHIGRLS